jgi:hypothetical protein
MTEIGKLIALQDDQGQVYMGYVTGVHEHTLDVDVIADNTYRGAALGVGR